MTLAVSATVKLGRISHVQGQVGTLTAVSRNQTPFCKGESVPARLKLRFLSAIKRPEQDSELNSDVQSRS